MHFYSDLKPHLEAVERAMERHLAGEDPRVYGMILPFIKLGGKRIRPMLCLVSCSACGGKYEDATEAASLIEIFHNFTLIHDDIEDSSLFRRGEPTLHVSFGVPIALNSGDALYTLLWNKIINLKMNSEKLVPLQRLYAKNFKRVVDGQGVELSWIANKRFDITEKDYFEMITGKTAALLGLSCQTGAMIAGADQEIQEKLREYGEKIGMAFQIQDDVLNLKGDFREYKKEIGGDISEGKRTLMVVHCLKNCNESERKRLISVLSSPQTKKRKGNEIPPDVQYAISLMEKTGSIDYCSSVAKKLVKEATELVSCLPQSRDRDYLVQLADYVISRKS